jgi:hypothetical protein
MCGLRDTGQISLLISTGYLDLGAYSANTWYKIEIEWRESDGKVRARFNDGSWTDWYAAYSGGFGAGTNWVEKFWLNTWLPDVSGTGYFDSFTITTPTSFIPKIIIL